MSISTLKLARPTMIGMTTSSIFPVQWGQLVTDSLTFEG